MSRGQGDVFFHMFVASKIFNSGYLYRIDIYPITHIWLAILYNFLPDFMILTVIFSIVFFIFYILSLYILGKTIIGTKKGGIFVSIFGIPLIFSYAHYAFYPFLFALFLFPLILYSYQKIMQNPNQKSRFYICLIFLSIFIVFCHPMISVFLIIMFSIFTFFELFKGWATDRRSNFAAANIVLIVSITLLLWWVQFGGLLRTLERISFALLGEGTHVSIIEKQAGAIATSDISTWLLIDRFIKVFGSPFFYFSISLFFLFYLLYQYYHKKKIYENDLIYSLQFCVATCIGIALMTGYFIIAEPIRAIMFGLIFATILCGLFFYRIYFSSLSKKRQLVLSTSITLVLTVICMLTMLALYSSPWISFPNTALTYGEKNGIDWILEYRNEKIPIVSETSPILKYSLYYYESTNARNDQNLTEYTLIIPSNFGYMTNRTIGDSFAYLPHKNVYMITPEMMKLTRYAVPVDRRNRLKSFTDSDFIGLKYDPSVNLVYLSKDIAVWNIAIPQSKKVKKGPISLGYPNLSTILNSQIE